MERSPYNYALGRLLQALRRERGMRASGDLARQLGVSGTTYRLIEAGRRPLPPHCLPDLAQLLRIDLAPLSALVALAWALAEGAPERRERHNRYARLGAMHPGLADLLEATSLADRGRDATTDEIEDVSALMHEYVFAGGQRGAPAAERSASVSPFYTDAVEMLLRELAPAEPVLSAASVFEWIADRARTLRRLRAYLSSVQSFALIGARESFVWDVLRNPYHPRFELVVPARLREAILSAIHQNLVASARRNPFIPPQTVEGRVQTMMKSITLVPADAGFRRAMQGHFSGAPDAEAEDHTYNLWFLEYAPAMRPDTSRLISFFAFDSPGGFRDSRRVRVLDAHSAVAANEHFQREWARLARPVPVG